MKNDHQVQTVFKNFNTNTVNNDEWLTPPDIIASLGAFDLDPCSPVNRPWDTATVHYTRHDNGLQKEWEGRVWLNPPYGRETFRWIERLMKHGNGIALIFARTETAGFHDCIWNAADSIFFFKGRLRFYHVNGKQGGTANAPSCLVSASVQNTETIQNALSRGAICGKLIHLQ